MSGTAGRIGLRSTAATTATVSESENVPSTSADSQSFTIQPSLSLLEKLAMITDSEDYGNMHRLVLQGIMTAGFLDATGVKMVFNGSFKMLDQTPPEQKQIYPYIQKVVREINEKIKGLDMMIKSTTCEITGAKYYVFLITIEKPMMRYQSFFTKAELELYQKIVEFILQKQRTFKMSMMECVNLSDELENTQASKVDAEYFVRRLISYQYLTEVPQPCSSNKFDITLGFRTVRELEPIFREFYQDIFDDCCLCKMILLNGLRCPKCTAVLHRACLKKYMKSCKRCVVCKVVWSTQDSLLIRTRDDIGEPSTPIVSQSVPLTPSELRSGRTGNNNKRRAEEDEEEEDVDMPVLLPMQPMASCSKRSISPARYAKYWEEAMHPRYIVSSSDSE